MIEVVRPEITMTEAWVPLLVAAVGVVLVGVYLRPRRAEPLVFADEREERLTREVARAVGCWPALALPAVRREIEYSPGQSDETLVKRAAYHYRQEAPERTCNVYQDRARG
jgi:hypothetical protein